VFGNNVNSLSRYHCMSQNFISTSNTIQLNNNNFHLCKVDIKVYGSNLFPVKEETEVKGCGYDQ